MPTRLSCSSPDQLGLPGGAARVSGSGKVGARFLLVMACTPGEGTRESVSGRPRWRRTPVASSEPSDWPDGKARRARKPRNCVRWGKARVSVAKLERNALRQEDDS